MLDVTCIENSRSVATCSADGSIHVWRVDLASSKSSSRPSVSPADHSPQRNTTSSSSSNSSIIKTLACSDGPVVGIQHFCGDVASVLSYITQSGKLNGWDLRASKDSFSFAIRPDLGYPTSMTTAPDRNWMCVGTSLGYICLWDLRYGVMCNLWRHSSKSPIYRLACCKPSSSGSRSTGANRELIMPHTEGANLFVSSGDNEAAVWSIPEGGECIKCFRAAPITSRVNNTTQLSELHEIPIPSSPLAPLKGPHVNNDGITVNDGFHPTVRAIMGRISQNSTSYLVTAGTDRYIRYWDLSSPSKCFTISGVDAAQPKSIYETPQSLSLRGKLYMCYDSDVPSPQATLQSQIPIREHRGPYIPTMRYKVIIAYYLFKLIFDMYNQYLGFYT